ncbi:MULTISPECIES: oligosaccharide flippase family protein [unclassified Myroides]|uniref:oligosaccharide flippase family protein n=1 Tax=unclassified Myroides TaxID=2642485 RepID=UPI003D2F6393
MQVKRSIVLLVSTLVGMFCLLITNKLITSVLTQDEFGLFSYSLNFFNFIQIITALGVFYPLSRALAKIENRYEYRKILGLGYFFVLVIFLLQLAIIIISYFFYFIPYKTEVVSLILISLPFVWIFSANNLSEVLFQSMQNVKFLAFYRFMPRLLFLVFVAFLTWYLEFISSLEILYCFLISYVLVHVSCYFALKPSYDSLKEKIKAFLRNDFAFGFNVYTGSLISLGAVSFTGVLIGFFNKESSEIGYYNLAIQLSTPLTLLPNVIATSNYTNFVNSRSLSKKILFLVVFVCILSLLLMYLSSDFIVKIIYGEDYFRVSDINKILIIGYFFYGIADCFNKFLLAKGFGKEIRNTSIIIGLCLFLSNIILIPKYSASGAAISVILAGVIYLVFSIYFYFTRKAFFE